MEESQWSVGWGQQTNLRQSPMQLLSSSFLQPQPTQDCALWERDCEIKHMPHMYCSKKKRDHQESQLSRRLQDPGFSRQQLVLAASQHTEIWKLADTLLWAWTYDRRKGQPQVPEYSLDKALCLEPGRMGSLEGSSPRRVKDCHSPEWQTMGGRGRSFS